MAPAKWLLAALAFFACCEQARLSAFCASPPRLLPAPKPRTVTTAGASAEFVTDRIPGVALVASLALLAKRIAAQNLAGGIFSPLLYATLTGLVVGNTVLKRVGSQMKSNLKPGVSFAKARLLRLGIILYGFKVSVMQILQLGPGSLAAAAAMTFSTLALGACLGRLLQVDRSTALLVTTGASICGVSAVMAAAPVVEKEGASGSKVSVALATVMVFGICSMFVYPLMWPKLAFSAKAMGIYTGATVYEVAGVVAAGNAMSPAVASAALLTKLVRVLLLAPFLLVLSRMSKGTSSKVQTPWFAYAFFGVCVLSSWLPVPAWLVAKASAISTWCTAMAMVGLGLESDVNSIRNMGWRPMLLASLLFAYLVVGGFAAVAGILRFLPA
ncbi:unnamed protein product [Effrenium voratum]|uniref:Sulfate exporter family transporter n=1 Tax=Effrenium voratum TaxID=2562239 RepID=A0AA36HM73_9DINO|nr:unnamed protein product [Effrenium voratum]